MRRKTAKLSVDQELAWLDYLDALQTAARSHDPRDDELAWYYWNRFMVEFMPPQLRVLCRKIEGGA